MRTDRALVFVVLLALSASACWGVGGEAEETAISLPTLTPFHEGLSLRLAGIAVKAAEVRGLELNEDITQGTLSQEKLGRYYDQLATDARLQEDTNYDALDTTYRLLHMIKPDQSILDVDGDEAAAGVLGFYTPEGEHLVLVSDQPDDLSLSNEATLAHEYVHSFQDHTYDLAALFELGEKDQREKANTEYADTLDALIEGDATVAELEYIKSKVGEEGLRKLLASEQEAAEALGASTDTPEALGRYAAFPYAAGSAFVRYLYDKGDWALVNEAYEEPPTTEEQILHPEKYLQREEAQDISLRDLSGALGEGWQQDLDAVFGEFDVYNWLRSTLDNEFQATSAAAGWGGGRLAVYTNELKPDSALLHIAVLWDNRQEAREFYTTFTDVLKLIDPELTPIDSSGQLFGWEAKDEAGRAWIDGTTFQMVVGRSSRDLVLALAAIDAPDTIPQSGLILRKDRSGDQRAAPPIRRLQDVLLRSGDLPPGFVAVQTSEADATSPFGGQNVEERSVFYSDVRSPGEGVVASASLFRGALPGGVFWGDLAAEDPRAFFDDFAGGLVAGNVTSFSAIDVRGIGEGALGARAEVQRPGGPRQRIELIAFGRGATMIVVVTIDDINSNELNARQYAQLMDDRLKRYTP